ncbi:MAG: hypothetical protein ACR2NR_18940 [Solirubrobacteraceae bacterium]
MTGTAEGMLATPGTGDVKVRRPVITAPISASAARRISALPAEVRKANPGVPDGVSTSPFPYQA